MTAKLQWEPPVRKDHLGQAKGGLFFAGSPVLFLCAVWTATTTVLITRHGCYQFGSLDEIALSIVHCLFVQCGLPVWGHCPASPQFWSSRHCGGWVSGHTFHLLPSWSTPLPGARHLWDQRPLQADCGVHRHRLRSEGQMHDGMVRVRFGRSGQCWVVWGCEAWWSRVWVEVSCCSVWWSGKMMDRFRSWGVMMNGLNR